MTFPVGLRLRRALPEELGRPDEFVYVLITNQTNPAWNGIHIVEDTDLSTLDLLAGTSLDPGTNE